MLKRTDLYAMLRGFSVKEPDEAEDVLLKNNLDNNKYIYGLFVCNENECYNVIAFNAHNTYHLSLARKFKNK